MVGGKRVHTCIVLILRRQVMRGGSNVWVLRDRMVVVLSDFGADAGTVLGVKHLTQLLFAFLRVFSILYLHNYILRIVQVFLDFRLVCKRCVVVQNLILALC